MRKCVVAVAMSVIVAGLAHAHFIWIVPMKDKAHVYFCDLPEADSPALLEKIAATEVFLRKADGAETAIEKTRGKQSFELTLPAERSGVLLGHCRYGVLSKPNTEPFLLMYYAKAHLANTDTAAQATPSKRLPLEIIRTTGKDGRHLQVLWQGKPLAGAEVVVIAPGDDLPKTEKRDQAGSVTLNALPAGTYGIRAKHVEDRAGEESGKAYKQVRHYSTLVFDVAGK